MALEWFGLETWIREDTLVGEKRVEERGRTRTLTLLNIHPFIPYIFLALVLCRVMRLEPFLGHRQEKLLDRWPVHYTHLYSHSLTVSSSPVLYVFGLWEKPRENINTERTFKLNNQRSCGTPIQHIEYLIILTRLMSFFNFYYYFRIVLLLLYTFFFSQVNFVNVGGFWFIKK